MQLFTVTSLALGVLLLVQLSADASAIPQGKELERAVASARRPFVLLNEQELEALRKAVRADGPKREAYLQPLGTGDSEYSGAGVLAIADKWLKTDVQIPARGGHGHHFFCDCGTQLVLPPDLLPRPDYNCPDCGKKYSGERYDAAVRCFHHHQLANAALHLALAYQIEQDRKYGLKVADILLKYAAAYPGPHTNHVTGGILYQSLNEAMWVIPLAQAYDLVCDSGCLTSADKTKIEDKLLRPAATGIRASGLGGNWGSWHLSAVGVVGLTIRDADMVSFAIAAFQNQITRDLGEDGLWPESVHCYHFFPLQAFVFFAEASHRAGIDLYNWEAKPGKSLKSMFTAPLDYMYPNFQLPAINDGWYAAWLPLDLYEVARRRWDDPAIAWALDAGYEIEADARRKVLSKSMSGLGGALLYGFLLGADAPEKPEKPAFSSVNYPNFGLCTLRNDRAMLTFHYGRFLGHGHLDKLSFTLYANDELLVQDYGTPGYGSKILGWYQSTAGHNTVVVDGKSQARSRESAIDHFHAGSIAQYAEASSHDCYRGVTHNRRILLVGNTCLIVDDLNAEANHDFDWLFRSEGEPTVTGEHASAKFSTSAYANVVFNRKDKLADGYRIDWTTAKSNLALGFWTAGEGLIGLGECPAETDSRHVSFMMCRQRGRAAKFAAVLAASARDERATIKRSGDVLQITLGDEVEHVSVRGIGDATAGVLATDGEIAAVSTKGGEVTGAALIHGTWLKWKGKTLIQRASRTGCTEKKL